MRRRIAIRYGAVSRAGNDLIANHKHSANGHLASFLGSPGLIQSGIHELRILIVNRHIFRSIAREIL
jgi:hypothetical protein